VLNDYFQLRTCSSQVPIRFAEQREMFDADTVALCPRHDLGICLAPCAMGCTRAQYDTRVRVLKRFLSGKDLSVLTRLEEGMKTAAAAQRFEEAAIYRDRFEAVESVCDQLNRFRTAQKDYSFIYPVPRRDGGNTWYLIRRGQVIAAVDEPSDGRGAERCLQIVDRTYAKSAGLAELRDDVETTMLVAGRFRSHPDELRRTMSPDATKERLRTMCADAVAKR
jgi:excinuclease ABC subunit C